MSRLERVALVGILLVAAALRLTGIDWDGFQHHHPDERYINWVATTVDFPSLGRLSRTDWQPATSTFNPFRWPRAASSEGIVVLQDQPRDFAYGHVPLYLGVLATRLVERVSPALRPLLPAGWGLTADVLNGAGRVEFHHLAAVGRALTALVDVGTVLITFLLGWRLFGARVGLLAAALLSVTVLHVQLAHFWTSDPYLTFFSLAALWAMVGAHQSEEARNGSSQGGTNVPTLAASTTRVPYRRFGYLLAGAAFVGLAIGSKFTAVLLLAPLLWTIWAGGRGRWLVGALAVATAVAVFVLTNPFAILDNTCPAPAEPPVLGLWQVPESFTRNCYLRNVTEQNGMVSGASDLGFTRQYAGTWPYLYFVEMQLRWGMGPLLGLLAFGGLGWALWRIVASLRGMGPGNWLDRLRADPLVILMLWVVPYFVVTGSFYVKFMRYMQPIAPLLVLFGAAALWQVRHVRARRAIAALVLGTTALYALAFTAIYREEHPWNVASRWIYENIPPGTTLLSEQWDDYLPVTMTLGDERRERGEYPNAELTWLSMPDAADDEAKLTANLEKLASAQYVTVVSNRVYGVVPRLPDRFPLTSQYHQLLFDGALGYELVWAGRRVPRIFGVSLLPDTFGWPGLTPPAALDMLLDDGPSLSFGRADESFVVYDQPLTMVFRNTGHLSAEQMRAVFQPKPR